MTKVAEYNTLADAVRDTAGIETVDIRIPFEWRCAMKVNDYIRKINYYETDKMGITHHSNYVRFMEEARVDFLEQIGCGYEKWEKDGIVSPVIGIECEYKRTTTFGDEIRIQVAIAEYKRIQLSVSYTMINTRTEQIVCIGKSHHCFVNREGKPIALSRSYPEYDELLKLHSSADE